MVEHVRALRDHPLVRLGLERVAELAALLADLGGDLLRPLHQQRLRIALARRLFLARLDRRTELREHRQRPLYVVARLGVHPPKEAGRRPRVAGRPRRLDQVDQRVAIAVRPDLEDGERVPARLPLGPERLPRSAPERRLPALERLLHRLTVRVRHHAHLTAAPVLRHHGQEPRRVPLQLVDHRRRGTRRGPARRVADTESAAQRGHRGAVLGFLDLTDVLHRLVRESLGALARFVCGIGGITVFGRLRRALFRLDRSPLTEVADE